MPASLPNNRRSAFVQDLLAHRLVFILRMPGPGRVAELVETLWSAGARFVEVTLNTPGALGVLRTLSRKTPPGFYLGAGTVRNAADVTHAHGAGVSFVVSPVAEREIIDRTVRLGIACIAGALTPTEINAAWTHGADFVKVFPAPSPGYIKAVHAPLDDVRLVAVGGVDSSNALDFLDAGAAAIAVGQAQLGVGADGRVRRSEVVRRAKALISIAGTEKRGGTPADPSAPLRAGGRSARRRLGTSRTGRP